MANNVFQKIGNTFMDLLCPDKVTCLLCSKEIKSGYLCAECESKVKRNIKNRCERCSRPTVSVEDNLCEQCKRQATVNFDKVVAPFIYEGTALGLIRALKYQDRRDIVDYFAPYMEKEYQSLPKTDIIIPVPMHKAKYLDRLYSQSEELCNALCERIDRKARVDLVSKIKDTGTQTVLNYEKRQENVKSSFRVLDKKEIKDKSVLIIDDVFTTGATVNELARVLKKAGASKVYALCACIANYKV